MHSLINLPAETVIKWAVVRLKSLQDLRNQAWDEAITSRLSRGVWLRSLRASPTRERAEAALRREIDRGARMAPDRYLSFDVSRVKEIMRLAGLAKTFGDGRVFLTEDDLGMLHAH